MIDPAAIKQLSAMMNGKIPSAVGTVRYVYDPATDTVKKVTMTSQGWVVQ